MFGNWFKIGEPIRYFQGFNFTRMSRNELDFTTTHFEIFGQSQDDCVVGSSLFWGLFDGDNIVIWTNLFDKFLFLFWFGSDGNAHDLGTIIARNREIWPVYSDE